MQRGRWSEAEELFRRAIDACPVDGPAHRLYAETLCHRGAMREAIAEMEEAARLSGGDAQVLVRLGEIYFEGGDFGHAESCARRAVDADAKLATAWALTADVARARGEETKAMAAYHRALSYREQYPRVQLALADIYRAHGRPQRALATLESLLDQYADGEEPADTVFLKGLTLKSLGRYEEAASVLTLAGNLGYPAADVLYELGEAELLAGRPASARLAIRQALELRPDHAASRALLARIEAAGGATAGTLRR